MSATPSLFEARHNAVFVAPSSRGSWVRFGPVFLEMHRWWFRFGVCARKWYLGAYLGPFVITIGRRTFAEPSPLWNMTSGTSQGLTVQWTLKTDVIEP